MRLGHPAFGAFGHGPEPAANAQFAENRPVTMKSVPALQPDRAIANITCPRRTTARPASGHPGPPGPP
jgi:hypothetical protein